ncbi:G protein-coupled receptor [Gaeumannomyces tritici R3-111a-1]|uniref:G protein-coupled receptor n=1 Tax=Gaeumannomyces tritici (strain R3-111a-1) TaxID=644352 RepID=J3NIG6_GAET3|nr:G protein-coupled receptor [Gaeumannomyces tritici R3-111a-1]EJT81059.1 G protein-coupled receptor [Gaeumannomyces tritici R3-111a-1]
MAISCGDDACAAGPPPGAGLAKAVSLSPFVGTFAAVSFLVARHVFPLLSRVQDRSRDDGHDHILPASAPAALRQCHVEHGARSLRRRVAAATFAATIGLSAVLAQLILAEISDLVDPGARATALRFTVPTLMLLLIVLIPFLELQSVITGAGWSFQRSAKGRIPRMPWVLLFSAFGAWLFVFWSLGMAVPAPDETYVYARDEVVSFDSTGASMGTRGGIGWSPGSVFPDLSAASAQDVSRACLERIGVIGISLMALLSGFASVSSPWHLLTDSRTHRRRPVTDAVVARKQAGVDATAELLAAKRHRLRSLQRKVAASSSTPDGSPISPGGASGLVGKLVGSIKSMGGGGGDAGEIKALQMEISGLESMESRLSSGVAALRSRQASHARDGTFLGRLMALSSYIFALYCVYRILATTMATLRRAYYPGASFSSSDPISRFLGLLARHWDPKLDQLAWARQISFLLSGVILAASLNSVLQTLHLFTKWAPGVLLQAQANLALLVGQVAATYVISAALLLRGSLPKEVSSAVGDVLESALEPGFVDRWFEGWFLVASVTTAVGIWIGRKIGGGADRDWDDWDEFAGEETGEKQS